MMAKQRSVTPRTEHFHGKELNDRGIISIIKGPAWRGYCLAVTPQGAIHFPLTATQLR